MVTGEHEPAGALARALPIGRVRVSTGVGSLAPAGRTYMWSHARRDVDPSRLLLPQHAIGGRARGGTRSVGAPWQQANNQRGLLTTASRI